MATQAQQMQMERDRAMAANRNREAEARARTQQEQMMLTRARHDSDRVRQEAARNPGTPVDPARQAALERREMQMREQMEKYFANEAQRLGITPERMNEIRKTPINGRPVRPGRQDNSAARRYPAVMVTLTDGSQVPYSQVAMAYENQGLTPPPPSDRMSMPPSGRQFVGKGVGVPKTYPKMQMPSIYAPLTDKQPYDDGTLANLAMRRATEMSKFGA